MKKKLEYCLLKRLNFLVIESLNDIRIISKIPLASTPETRFEESKTFILHSLVLMLQKLLLGGGGRGRRGAFSGTTLSSGRSSRSSTSEDLQQKVAHGDPEEKDPGNNHKGEAPTGVEAKERRGIILVNRMVCEDGEAYHRAESNYPQNRNNNNRRGLGRKGAGNLHTGCHKEHVQASRDRQQARHHSKKLASLKKVRVNAW